MIVLFDLVQCRDFNVFGGSVVSGRVVKNNHLEYFYESSMRGGNHHQNACGQFETHHRRSGFVEFQNPIEYQLPVHFRKGLIFRN